MKKTLLPAILLFTASCLNNVEEISGEQQANVSFADDVQPILTQHCVSCHGNSGGVNLSSYQALISSTGNAYGNNLVVPEDAVASGLYDKLLPSPRFGTKMPQGGSLSGNQIEIIKTWINEGAENN